MQSQQLQEDVQLPPYSKPEAENLARQAVAAYVANQNEETLDRMWDAAQALSWYDPPTDQSPYVHPSMRFVLDLLPEHLLHPNPFWGDAMFD